MGLMGCTLAHSLFGVCSALYSVLVFSLGIRSRLRKSEQDPLILQTCRDWQWRGTDGRSFDSLITGAVTGLCLSKFRPRCLLDPGVD